MQRGLSPEQVAEVLDIAPADLAQIERGALDLDLDRVEFPDMMGIYGITRGAQGPIA